MTTGRASLSSFERFLTLFAKIRPGEGRCIMLLFSHAFLLLLAYYLIRPVREALILTDADAQIRSLATAFQAGLLLILIPLYSAMARRRTGSPLVQRVNAFFLSNLLIFALLGHMGVRYGAIFFIWAGLFSVGVVANFWAFAADLLNVKTGKRLFAIIAVGATGGAWVGARINSQLFEQVGPYNLMILSAVALSVTLWLSPLSERAVPPESRSDIDGDHKKHDSGVAGGFKVVFSSRYLVLIALLVFVVNWLTATGDNILAAKVGLEYDRLAELETPGLDRESFYGTFYGGFFSWVTLLGFLIQLFLVSRLFRWFGIHGSLLIPAVLFAGGFAAIGFVPVFALMQVVFILQKSTDYSLLNTTRSALFLPVGRSEKYEGKTTIDTFFWRFGDLASGGATIVSRNVLGQDAEAFLNLNIGIGIVLSAVLLAVSIVVGRQYRVLAKDRLTNAAPTLNKPIPDATVPAGQPFVVNLDDDSFLDSDPGDLLQFRAMQASGEVLPPWIRFDPSALEFSGTAPAVPAAPLEVEVVATDDDGLSARDTFRVRIVH